jgi:uncharacterized membrane protein YcaP (DUF421 family)
MVTALMRTIILYLFIVVCIRLMGKRQIGELEPSELVLSLLLADIASVPMQDFGIPLFAGMIPILALISVSAILSVLTVKNIRMRAILNGRPSIVIQNGKIRPKEMLKNRFTADELMEELRISGQTDISKIKCATLETSGRLSVIPYAADQPVTAKQMNLPTQEAGLPVILINDGRLIEHNLKECGLDRIWLMQQLNARGVHSQKEIFLLTVDENHKIYYTTKTEPA